MKFGSTDVMRTIMTAFVALVALLAAGDIIRRVPESIAGLRQAERRQAWRSTALAALLVLSAYVAMTRLGTE